MNRTHITLLLIFSFLSLNAFGQEWTHDTVKFGNKFFITELPNNFKKNLDPYNEGVFIFYSFPDTSVFRIFYGFNATLSKPSNYDTLSVDGKVSFGLADKNKYWKSFKKSKSLIWGYDRVSKDQLNIFDQIFDSIVVKNIRGGG